MPNTALKRASAVNVSLPWRGILPFPTGLDADTSAERATVAFMYAFGDGGVAPVVRRIPFDSGLWPPQDEIDKFWHRQFLESQKELAASQPLIEPEPPMVEAAAPVDPLIAIERAEIAEIYEILEILDEVKKLH